MGYANRIWARGRHKNIFMIRPIEQNPEANVNPRRGVCVQNRREVDSSQQHEKKSFAPIGSNFFVWV